MKNRIGDIAAWTGVLPACFGRAIQDALQRKAWRPLQLQRSESNMPMHGCAAAASLPALGVLAERESPVDFF